MDIITRTSDGRVMQAAPGISLEDDRYIVSDGPTITHEPVISFGTPVQLIKDVPGVPSDLIGGWNYNYVSGSFEATGHAPPQLVTPGPWDNKAAISPTSFIALATGVLGPVGFNRLETDSASSAVYSEIITAASIDPNGIDPVTNENTFQVALAYLKAANGADGHVLLTGANETALIAAWPNK